MSTVEPSAGAAPVSIIRSAPSRYDVRGPLTFATARGALRQGLDAFGSAPAGPIEIDFQGVGTSDSAGLAVLIEWLAWARRNGRELRYTSVPEAICAIARISEVDGLLLPA